MLHSLKNMFEGKRYFQISKPNQGPQFRQDDLEFSAYDIGYTGLTSYPNGQGSEALRQSQNQIEQGVQNRWQNVEMRNTSLTTMSQGYSPDTQIRAYQNDAQRGVYGRPGQQLFNQQSKELQNSADNFSVQYSNIYAEQAQKFGLQQGEHTDFETSLQYEDQKVQLEWDRNGNITADSLAKYLANLDGNSEVAVRNNPWYRRIFLGEGQQRYVSGEAQVLHLLKGKSVAELNAIVAHVTGFPGMNVNFRKGIDTQEKTYLSGNRDDRTRHTKEVLNASADGKIKLFQRELLAKASAMADIMEVMLTPDGQSKISGVPAPRGGLASVLNGNENALFIALNDPQNAERFAQLVKSSPKYQDRTVLDKLLGTLFRFGLSVAFRILSVGTMSAKWQVIDIDSKKYAPGKDGQMSNMDLDWKSGKATWHMTDDIEGGVDINVLSADLFLNWNNPENEIRKAQGIYNQQVVPLMRSNDFNPQNNLSVRMTALQNIVSKAEQQSRGLDANKQQKVREYGEIFLRTQQLLIQQISMTVSNPNLSNTDKATRLQQIDAQIQNKISFYVAQVAQLNGAQVQGIYGTFGMEGLQAGLTVAGLTTGASIEGISKSSGMIEAVLTANEIAGDKLLRVLSKYGITQGPNGTFYSVDGQAFTRPLGPNEQLQWQVYEDAGFEGATLRGQITIINKTTGYTETIPVNIKALNRPYSNSVIENNSAQIAQTMMNLRNKGNKAFTEFQRAAVSNDIDSAVGALKKINNPLINQAIREGEQSGDLESVVGMMLAKTSGGRTSRDIAKGLNSGSETIEGAKARILEYYSKHKDALARRFAQQFGIDVATVKGLVEQMLISPQVSSLDQWAQNGFNAAVAYSQGDRFRTLDWVSNGNAQIIGQPVNITGSAADSAVRSRIQQQIPSSAIQAASQYLAQSGYGSFSQQETLQLITSGAVKSYLSYEPNAECFNLGFFVEPGAMTIHGQQSIMPQNIFGQGAAVGRETTKKWEFGAAFGWKWDTPEDTPNTTPEDRPGPPRTPTTPPRTPGNPGTPDTPWTTPEVSEPLFVTRPGADSMGQTVFSGNLSNTQMDLGGSTLGSLTSTPSISQDITRAINSAGEVTNLAASNIPTLSLTSLENQSVLDSFE